MVRDHGRRLAQHDRHVLRGDLASVEDAVLCELPRRGRRANAVAEIVLAARIELDIGRKDVAVFLQEADEATVVVDVAVADDQRLDLGRVHLKESHIVDDGRRGVAEVEQDRALLLLTLQFQEERQAPLIVQDVACVRAAAWPWSLVNDTIDRAGRQKLVMLLVDQNADRELVDRWYVDRRRTAISMQVKLDAAAPAITAEALRKSRRGNDDVIGSSSCVTAEVTFCSTWPVHSGWMPPHQIGGTGAAACRRKAMRRPALQASVHLEACRQAFFGCHEQ